jgi:hypothetical protein
MGLIAINFSYVGYQKAETFRFYQRILRGFLRWHRTQVVWIKGFGRRKAYLLLTDHLVKNAVRMFCDGLNNGGYFKAEALDPIKVLQVAKENEVETVGYLSYSNVQLGDSNEIFCPQDDYQKVTVDYCRGHSYEERCYSWDNYRCVYPNLTRTPKAKQKQLEKEMKA